MHNLIRSLGLFQNNYSTKAQLKVAKPTLASRKDLELYHTSDYLDYVLNPHATRSSTAEDTRQREKFSLEDDCPVFDGLHEYVPIVAGASLTAAATLKNTDISICWDGGR